MIAKIKGNVEAVNGNRVIVDVNGLGYEVQCPERSINAIEKNKFISLYIQTILRDDTINLYGFLSLEEKRHSQHCRLFRSWCKISYDYYRLLFS